MKKSLLAVAIVAALPVVAQAQTNVTMFGLLDASLVSTDRKAPAPGPARQFRLCLVLLQPTVGVFVGLKISVAACQPSFTLKVA